MGKGSGGGTTYSQGTTNTSNIPEYARPYVETMLGATQQQLFKGDKTEDGGFNITGFKPYQAYGGTYDKEGNQLSYDPSKAIAGFSPLQRQAQAGTAALQVPGQFGTATDITGMGIMGAMGTAGQARGLQGMGMQAAQAGNQYAQQATNPYAMSAYMSPYMQNVVEAQQSEAQRASDIQAQQNQAAAVGQGAFGGSRQGLIEAERQRNLATQKGAIQTQGLQSAFQNAQQAQQYGANLGLQGLQAGAGMYGQGIGAQQAAYGMGLQGASQLGALGGQQLAAQQSILGAQNQAGAQQQAREQQIINQAMTDYANAQQYPLMQLGTMSNMIRGLPMQSQSTSQYAAAPNAITQGIGAVGALSSLAAANPGKAEGGIIEGYASGGITSYDVGGQVESQLEDMDIDGLKRQVKESSSPSIKRMAQRILAEKQMPAPRMAGGGIIAFSGGDEVKARKEREKQADLDRAEMMKPIAAAGDVLLGGPYNAVATGAERLANTIGVPRLGRALGIYDSDVTSVEIPKIGSGTATPYFDKYVREAQANAGKAAPVAEKAAEQAAEQAAAVDKNKTTAETPAVKERPAPAPAPAAEPRQPGILSASPRTKPDEFMDPLIKERDRYTKEASQDRGVLAKKLEEEAGTNVGRENYRAEEMARRANLKDEAERQKQMRLAEFFASWGSTPGPVLVAGMNALKKSIPGMVEDSKEAKKLQRESDKIIYDIDEATRLEKAGYRKESQIMIQQAATNASHLNSNIASYAGHKLTADASMANAAAQREATSANKAIAAEENKIKTLLQAQGNTTNLLRVHEAERKDPEYANASSMAKIGKDENGLDKPLDKIPKELRGQISEARKIVNQYTSRQKQELQAAREQEAALTERTSLSTGKNKATDKNDILGIR